MGDGRGPLLPRASRRPRRSLRLSLSRYLRSLDPRLPPRVWALELGVLLNAFGTGMVLPFVVIYLHNVRGFDLAVAGLVVSTFAAVSFVSTAVAGAIIDRRGARAILGGSLVVLALAYGSFPLVHEPWQAFLVMALAGIGNGGYWPSESSLLAGLAAQTRRHSAFAVQRAAFNLGIGLGGGAGGLIAATSEPDTFTVLFLVDAATFLLYLVLLPFIRVPRLPSPQTAVAAGRYRDVLRDRLLLAVVGLNVVYVAAGYAQWEVSFPVFTKNEAGVSERAIGTFFFLNSFVIVAAQLPIARILEGRRRMAALAVMTLMWAGAWLVVLAGGLQLEAGAAVLALGVAVVVFALGECVLGPAQSALVADLAPDRLRGRYLAMLTNSYAIGFTIGPAAGGALLDASPAALWLSAAALLLAAGAGALVLDRRLPESLRRAPVRDAR